MTTIRPTDRIVLACSGDLATSIAIPWLAGRYGAEIVTVTLDVGQPERLDDIRERALAAGASRAHVIDAREEFARDFVLPALHGGMLDDERDVFALTLKRLLVARHLVALAAVEDAVAVAHGIDVAAESASFSKTIRSMRSTLRVIAPAREWRLTRPAQVEYARAHDIPVLEPVDRPAATSTNMWGRCTPLDATSREAAMGLSRRTNGPDGASVSVRFDRGVPVALNDVELPLVDLIGTLATIGKAHDVGLDARRTPASESGVAFDAPAGAILGAACRDLRSVVLPAGTQRHLSSLAARGAALAGRGRWFTPARTRLLAVLDEVREQLTGTVRVDISNGRCVVVDCDVPAPHASRELPAEELMAPMVPHHIVSAGA